MLHIWFHANGAAYDLKSALVMHRLGSTLSS